MKILLVAATVALGIAPASAQLYGAPNSNPYGSSGLSDTGSNPNSHYVAPHTNSSGTYIQGHQQTNPNNTQFDNYSTRGNLNPYTGQYGTRSPRY